MSRVGAPVEAVQKLVLTGSNHEMTSFTEIQYELEYTDRVNRNIGMQAVSLGE